MNAAIAPDPWEGRVVEGKYPLLELLGSGPHGPVFRTKLPGPNQQPAAIKLISLRSSNPEAQLSRLRAASQLSHPHLLKIFEVGACQIKGTTNLFVVMEFAEENLGQVLPSRPLTADETVQMLDPILRALGHLHEQGMVHASLQPSNIMAVSDTLKLSTDGIYKTGSQVVPVKIDKSPYVAPELANGLLTPAADVWSLGATLVAALKSPGPSSPVAGPDSIPEPFRQIARECLKPDPNERCKLPQIKDWLAPQANPSTPKSPETVTLRRRRINPILLPAAALLIFVFVFAVWSRIGSKPAQHGETASLDTPSASSQATDTQWQASSAAPSVLERVMPNISASALHTVHGKIKITARVDVNDKGEVTDAKLTTAGPSKYFAAKVLQSARNWKFRPSVVDGRAKPSAWVLKYQITHSGTEVNPTLIQ